MSSNHDGSGQTLGGGSSQRSVSASSSRLATSGGILRLEVPVDGPAESVDEGDLGLPAKAPSPVGCRPRGSSDRSACRDEARPGRRTRVGHDFLDRVDDARPLDGAEIDGTAVIDPFRRQGSGRRRCRTRTSSCGSGGHRPTRRTGPASGTPERSRHDCVILLATLAVHGEVAERHGLQPSLVRQMREVISPVNFAHPYMCRRRSEARPWSRRGSAPRRDPRCRSSGRLTPRTHRRSSRRSRSPRGRGSRRVRGSLRTPPGGGRRSRDHRGRRPGGRPHRYHSRPDEAAPRSRRSPSSNSTSGSRRYSARPEERLSTTRTGALIEQGHHEV